VDWRKPADKPGAAGRDSKGHPARTHWMRELMEVAMKNWVE